MTKLKAIDRPKIQKNIFVQFDMNRIVNIETLLSRERKPTIILTKPMLEEGEIDDSNIRSRPTDDMDHLILPRYCKSTPRSMEQLH